MREHKSPGVNSEAFAVILRIEDKQVLFILHSTSPTERERLPEPIEKAATRNMFYNENGKHVRTKKEKLDEAG